jgi:hypothetical protein
MYLSKVRLKNYKCFRDSGDLGLEPGLTVVFGVNNSGKSAFLRALHSAEPHPYRSLEVAPVGQSPDLDFEITCSKKEVVTHLRSGDGYSFYFPAAQTTSWNPNHSADLFRQWIEKDDDVVIRGTRMANSVVCKFDGFGLWEPLKREHDGALIWIPNSGPAENRPQNSASLEANLAGALFSSVYRFDPERPRLGKSQVGPSMDLANDASNLPTVLNSLQKNPEVYKRFIGRVTRVMPSVRWIAPVMVSQNEVKLDVWFVDPRTERDDLAIPLSECGTGLGQVVAILYVATVSATGLLLVDEPQSYLHPAAARELVQILGETKRQCIITTHSSEVLGAVESSALVRVEVHPDGAQLRALDPKSRQDLRRAMQDLGVRLSDMFGPDRILWVEGPTEETCLPLLWGTGSPEGPRTRFLAVQSVGDFFDRKHAHLAISLYKTLTEAGAVLAPTAGFLFDRERLKPEDIDDLRRRVTVPVKVLARRMFENYLLDLDALSAILTEDLGAPIAPGDIVAWTQSHLASYVAESDQAALGDSTFVVTEHIFGDSPSPIGREMDAAQFLGDLFSDLSRETIRFSKVEHGERLCAHIVARKSGRFSEIRKLVEDIFKEAGPPS